MTSYYTPTQQPSSSLHDYYYASAPSSSASAARATRRAPRPSPMAVAPPMTYARTYSATRTSTRPQMARAPASAPAAVKYTPSYAPTRTHEPCEHQSFASREHPHSQSPISAVQHAQRRMFALVASQAARVLRHRTALIAQTRRICRRRQRAPGAPLAQHVGARPRDARRMYGLRPRRRSRT
jgi:hypothetical protein